MMSTDEYVRKMFDLLPRLAKDALDPQRIQAALAVNIDKYYGESNRNPVYPRTDGGNTLQFVTGNLYKAATVYRAKGNLSGYKETGNNTFQGGGGSTTFSAFWGIDLNVIPYARIHEYGGTINHPGGTPYKIVNGRAVFVSKARGAGLPVTKPHDITMPARPYITPAFKDFDQETFPKIIEIMLRKLAQQMAS